MRTHHYPAITDFPVYALAFAGDDRLFYAGGGGPGRSGVKNRIRLVRVPIPAASSAPPALTTLSELELSSDEDAPMTLAIVPSAREINEKNDDTADTSSTSTLVAGINRPESLIKEGRNENLRVFKAEAKEGGIKVDKAVKTMTSLDPEQYQKAMVFSPDGNLLGVGSTDGQFSLLSYPSLVDVLPPLQFKGEEVLDADFSLDAKMVAIATPKRLCIYATALGTDSERKLIQTIERPVVKGQNDCVFRNVRFSRSQRAPSRLFTLVNSVASRTAKKGAPRKAFVSIWNTETWELVRTRSVSDKPVTGIDLSSDGKLFAYGSSDLSVGVLQADTLRPVLHILRAHDFPATAIKFNPSASLLVTASADNTLRVMSVPKGAAEGGGVPVRLILLLLSLLLILLAIFAQRVMS